MNIQTWNLVHRLIVVIHRYGRQTVPGIRRGYVTWRKTKLYWLVDVAQWWCTGLKQWNAEPSLVQSIVKGTGSLSTRLFFFFWVLITDKKYKITDEILVVWIVRHAANKQTRLQTNEAIARWFVWRRDALAQLSVVSTFSLSQACSYTAIISSCFL